MKFEFERDTRTWFGWFVYCPDQPFSGCLGYAFTLRGAKRIAKRVARQTSITYEVKGTHEHP